MSFYLGAYAIINPFEEMSESTIKICSNDVTHFIENSYSDMKKINFCSVCGKNLIIKPTGKSQIRESNHFNLKNIKKIDFNSNKFDCIELNNKKTLWKIKDKNFALNIEDHNQGNQEIHKGFREKSIKYFNTYFYEYEEFFEKNDILFVVDFGFISEI